MVKTLEEQVRGLLKAGEKLIPHEITTLVLDHLTISQITTKDKKFIENFVNLEVLSLNYVGLKSLACLPAAPKLKHIEVGGNRLAGIELKRLLKYPQLERLSFVDNSLAKWSDI